MNAGPRDATDKIPLTVVHYDRVDPRQRVGGVESFARNLEGIFETVLYMTPAQRDLELVRRERLPVICTSQRVLDWPEEVPVIGFWHGLAAEKVRWTGRVRDLVTAWAQARAARRRNTLWIACAGWLAAALDRVYGLSGCRVIYHPIDLTHFDGRRDGWQRDLVLHDARTPNKGRRLIRRLAADFPEWRFEPLDCAPEDVPARMRMAAAFVHLSRYEGNSMVCNEAMAMDLPCLFTRVGLMRDEGGPAEFYPVDPDRAFRTPAALRAAFAGFVESLGRREYHPRGWMEAHAGMDVARQGWREAIADLAAISGGGPSRPPPAGRRCARPPRPT